MPAADLKRWNFTAQTLEAILVTAAAVVLGWASYRFDLFEMLYEFSKRHEEWELDELFTLLLFMAVIFFSLTVRRTRQLKREISQRIIAECEAMSLARHDALTGLLNRRAFSEEARRAAARSGSAGSSISLLLIDLDRFKPVNDLGGHAAGDKVLCTIARRLQEHSRKDALLARLGGDEFAMLIEHDLGTDAPTRVASRMIKAVQQPIEVGDRTFQIGASVGIAAFRKDGETVEELLRAADLALYRAKYEGRSTFRYYEHAMDVELRQRRKYEHELRDAIRNGDIRPHYQPLVSLDDGRLLGFEMLARWYHPKNGIIRPDAFIPVAEEAGLIGDLMLSILRQGCRDARRWPPTLCLSINMSPSQLQDQTLPQVIFDILAEMDFSPTRLEVEITESALVGDLVCARTVLSALHEQGVQIALDDFGTGYSSLYHLRTLKFDKLKIDRSFIRDLDDPESIRIVNAIIGLGKSLDLSTTAEGIETSADAELLRRLGCDIGQGFLFGKPTSAVDMHLLPPMEDVCRAWLSERGNASIPPACP